MRRLIRDAVQVRAPWTDAQLLALDVSLTMDMPTEDEVRDAAAKLQRQMQDTVQARIGASGGWTVGDLTTRMISLDRGEVCLQGVVIIERADA